MSKTAKEIKTCLTAILNALERHEGSNADAQCEDCPDYEKCDASRYGETY